MIVLREDRDETYLLLPDIARELPGEFLPVVLYTAINRQGVIRLWPVRLPAPDGRVNEWHRSAAEAANPRYGALDPCESKHAVGRL